MSDLNASASSWGPVVVIVWVGLIALLVAGAMLWHARNKRRGGKQSVWDEEIDRPYEISWMITECSADQVRQGKWMRGNHVVSELTFLPNAGMLSAKTHDLSGSVSTELPLDATVFVRWLYSYRAKPQPKYIPLDVCVVTDPSEARFLRSLLELYGFWLDCELVLNEAGVLTPTKPLESAIQALRAVRLKR